MNESEIKPASSDELLQEIRGLIVEARRQTAAALNVDLTLLYWRVGSRIHLEVLGSERAADGEQIVATLSRQLSWSHFRILLPPKQPFQREFYAEISRIEGWSVRTLQERIEPGYLPSGG